jgi:SAM-dependent methyltransferase
MSPIADIKKAVKAQYPQAVRVAGALLYRIMSMLPLSRRGRMRDTFSRVYLTNAWGGQESASGVGSSLDQTVVIRSALPVLLKEIEATSLLDAPCGDHFWMAELTLNLDYVGVDVVPAMIEQNRGKYQGPGKNFLVRDITRDRLPDCDCVLCRDCLDHLSFEDALRALNNFRRSRAKYLLVTTYTDCTRNDDIVSGGGWRPTNLQLPPYSFPVPLWIINEQCTEEGGKWADKSLALWRIQELPLPGNRLASSV